MNLAVVVAAALGAVNWQQVQVTRGANTDGAAFTEHASGWDSAGSRLVVFNRDGRTYQLSAASATWDVVNTGDVSPPARFSMVYGVDGGGLVICSGEASTGGSFFNDVWRFDFQTNRWTELAALNAAGAPETRYGAAGGVQQNADGSYSLVITHGFSSVRYSNAFTFHLTTRQWTRIESGENEYSLDFPHARCLVPGAVTRRGEIFMFGGCLSGGETGGPCPAWDGWCRDTSGDWHRITDGSPHPRTRGLMVPYPPQVGVSLLITSGTTSTGAQWLQGDEAPGGDVGVIDCSNRKWVFKRPGGTQPPRLFDASVAWNTTHIFITGGRNGDNGNQGVGVDTWVLTWDNMHFDNAADASGTGSYLTLVILHGVFMFLAWGICCPVGAFVARYLKARDPLWFKIHRILMPVGVLFTVIGFGLIIPAINGSGHFAFVHGAIGLVVIILALLQPLNAVLRPHKPEPGQQKSTLRFVWEIVHRWSGRVAVWLGLINLVLGVVIAVAPLAVFIVCLVWVCVMFLLWIGAEVFFRVKYGFCSDWQQCIADEQLGKKNAGESEPDAVPAEHKPNEPDAQAEEPLAEDASAEKPSV